ncbi:hypothetical protein F383_24234 [Gossypium arboreum]|uniref:Uncharacterized protein n=1 Tax=Gossypium arboreum TaxID=29729 RepID=A0A0B0P0B5_GOSAR|nr:hypothetical protein F383_24234 [Gossypium arboreum]
MDRTRPGNHITRACPFFKELYFTQKMVLRPEESQSKAYINTLSVT